MKSARDTLRAELQKAREDIANATSLAQYDRAKKRALIERKYRRA